MLKDVGASAPAQQSNTVRAHPCGICGAEHSKDHCPACGAHPWEGYDAREPWPDASDWDSESPPCDGSCGRAGMAVP